MSFGQKMKLNEAGVTLIDCDHKTPAAQASGYPYVGIPQLKDGHIRLDGARLISEEDFVLWTKKAKPQLNDVILSRRCNPGESAYVPESLEIALGQNLVLLRSDGSVIYPPFLRWLVQGNEWWEQVNKFLNVGAVFNSLKCKDIPNFKLTIPSLKEQKRITDILSGLDKKIELNNKINQNLESIAQAIFKSWFIDFEPVRVKIAAKQEGSDPELAAMCVISGKSESELEQMVKEDFAELQATAALFPDELVESELGEVPKGWEITRFSNIVEKYIDNRGKTPPIQSEGIPLLEVKHLPEFSLNPDLNTDKKVSLETFNTWFRAHLQENDLIMSTVGTIGRLCIVPANRTLAIAQNILGLRFKLNKVNPLFMYYQMNSAKFRNDVDARLVITVQSSIKRKDLETIDLLQPDIKIQNIFAEKIKPFVLSQQSDESLKLIDIRDTLLPKLLSGEIDVSDFQGEVAGT